MCFSLRFWNIPKGLGNFSANQCSHHFVIYENVEKLIVSSILKEHLQKPVFRLLDTIFFSVKNCLQVLDTTSSDIGWRWLGAAST